MTGGLASNLALTTALLAFACAQSLKVVTHRINDGKWDLRQLVTSGGMPSSHSALVCGLTMTVGLDDGFGEPLFAACGVFALIVMYDAAGVRLHAGRQAEVLNQIITELPPEHPVRDTRPLREMLGHTNVQVAAGGLLGALVALIRCSVAWHGTG